MQKIWKQLICLYAMAQGLDALPRPVDVASGEVAIAEIDSGVMQIEASDRAIINYTDFSIARGEKVRFIQPSKEAVVLNRVVGSDPSKILGRMTSNGRVVLVNPNGVYFGKDAIVDTGSLIVSTLDILDQDFLESKYSFHLKDKSSSSLIHNEGTLIASEGMVALISPQVKNEGIIRASLDKVIFASGEAITLSFEDDGLMSFEMAGDTKDAFIEQAGSIQAGSVFLRVGEAQKAIEAVINTEGIVTANTLLVEENGKVRITHESHIKAKSVFIESSDVFVEGEIDVSNRDSQEKGGTVHILGDNLELRGARINASGGAGGGTVLIGGEYKGGEGVRTASVTTIDESTSIQANALVEGDGGRVIVWADGTTLFNGMIYAQGGEIAGDGGFVETSGKENLYVGLGMVNTLSSQGKAGMWLLDPTTLTIVPGTGTATLPLTCSDATTPTIGTTTINAATSNVTLCATSTITQNADANIAISTSGVTLTFTTGGSSTIQTTLNAGVATTGGAIQFTSTTIVLGSGKVVTIDTTNNGTSAAGANISFDSTGTINGTAGTETLILNGGTGGTVSFGAAIGGTTSLGEMTVTASTITQSSTALISGILSYTGSTAINIEGGIATKGGTASFTGPVSLTNNFSIDMTNAGASLLGGNISFSSTISGATSLTLVGGTSGNVTLSGAIGGTALSSLTVSGLIITQSSTLTTTGAVSYTTSEGITLGGAVSTSGGAISFTGPVTISAGFTISSAGVATGAGISFSNAINGAQALILNAGSGGTITLGGSIGSNAPLTNLTFTNSAGIQIGGSIRVTGANTLTFGQAVTLSGSSFLTSTSGNLTTTFSSTINGAQALSITGGTGAINFTGAIGGNTPLTALTVTTSGVGTATQSSSVATVVGVSYTTSTANNIKGSITTQGGSVLCTGPVVLTNNVTIDTTNGGSVPTGNTISFSSTVNGASNFILQAGTEGAITFGGIVGGSTTLTSLTLTANTLAQNNTVTVGTGGASYTAKVLTIVNALSSVGSVTITGGLIGSGNYLISSSAGNVTFSGTVDVNGGLNVSGTNVLFSGNIGSEVISPGLVVSGTTITQGANARVTSISYTASGGISLGGSITLSSTTANPLFSGPITLTANVILDTTDGGTIPAGRSVGLSAVNGAFAFTVNCGTGSTIGLGSAVGATTPLASLSLIGIGITQSSTVSTTGAVSYSAGSTGISLNGNITTSGGAINMTGATTLTAGITLDTTNGGSTAAGNNITFSAGILGAFSLTLKGGTAGVILMSSSVSSTGETNALTSFTVTGGTITQSSTVISTGAVSYTGVNEINLGGAITTSGGVVSFTGPVVLTSAIAIDSTNAGGSAGANISFSGTINGIETLTLTAGTGTISLSGVIGGSLRLSSLTVVSAASLTQSAAAAMTGALSYTATAINVQGSITTSGSTIGFTGAVIVAGSPTLDTTNGQIVPAGANISFSTTLNGAGALTLHAGTGGTVSFPSAVGAVTALTSLSVIAGTITQTSTVTTTGALSYTGGTAINIKGNITTSGGAITMTGPITLTNSNTFDTTANSNPGGANISFSSPSASANNAVGLTLKAGTGGIISFAGSGGFGGTTGPTSLTISSANTIQLGTSFTTPAAINFQQPVSLIGTSSVSTGGTNGNITFSSTLNGSYILSLVAGTGTVLFSGIVGGTTPVAGLTFTSTNLIQVGNSITVSGVNALTFPVAVSVTGTSTITSNNANITFSAALSGSNALTLQGGTGGTVLFSSTVGTGTALASLSATANVITQTSTVTTTGALSYTGSTAVNIEGNVSTSGGSIGISGPTFLTNSPTFNSTVGSAAGANITFSGTLDGANTTEAPTFQSGTAHSTTFSSAVGGISPLANLSFGTVNLIQIGANITVTGANPLNFSSAVGLIGSSTITSNNANITFTSTLNGADSLILQGGTAATTFDSAVGGSTALTGLSVTSSTITQISTVTTTGALSYTGGTAINIEGNITTSGGAITMTGPITLTNSNTFDTTANSNPGGANISFSSSSTSANNAVGLTLKAGTTGIVSFSGSGGFGGTTGPTSLTFTSANTIEIGTTLTVAGAVSFPFPVLLIANSTVSSGNSNGNINFQNTLNGAYDLALVARTGTVILTGVVGGNSPLNNISFTSASLIEVGNNITVTGVSPLLFPDPVSLIGSSTITSNNADITFETTVISSVSGASSLTLQGGTGTLTFAGQVGATPLAFLNATSSTIAVEANVSTSGGIITLTGSTWLTNSPTFNSTVGNAAGANITFSGSLNGTNSLQAPTFQAGTAGNVIFSGAVGGVTPLVNLSFTSAALIEVGANITVTGANPLVFPDPVSLTGNSTITSNNANISFSSTLISSVSGASALTAFAGTGTITFSGAVGSTALEGLTAIGSTVNQNSTATTVGAISYIGSTAINLSGAVTTSSGAISFTGPTSLLASFLISSASGGGAAISFAGSLNGAESLTVHAGTGAISFLGTIGGITPLTALTAVTSGTLTQAVGATLTGTLSYTGSLINLEGNITTSAGGMTFTGPVEVFNSPIFDTTNGGGSAGGASVSFSSTLNGSTSLTILGGTSGTVHFTGAVGGVSALTTLSVTSSTITQSSTMTTTGALSYTGSTAINIEGNITTSGGAITITGPITLVGSNTFDTTANGNSGGANISFSSSSTSANDAVGLTLKAGTNGIISFSGSGGFGGTTGPTSLTFTSANTIEIGTNITVAGAVSFPFPVVLTASSTVSSGNSNGNVQFQSTVNGAYALTTAAGTGIVIFNSAVGGVTPPTNLIFSSASLIEIGNNITVSGANPLVFSEPVSLIGSSTITSNNSNITFSSTLISSLSGGSSLIVEGGTGTLLFAGIIGGTPLASLTATSATITQSSSATTVGALSYTGSTAINIEGNITTSGGAITMTGPSILTNSPIFNSTSGATTGANIDFDGTLDGADTTEAPTFESGTASNVIFSGAVGGNTPLANLIFGVVDVIEVGANITVTGSNPLDFSSPVSLIGESTITSNSANITFTSTLDGEQVLVLIGGIGTTTFEGEVGGTTPLTSLSVTSKTIQVQADVTTNGGFIDMVGATLLTNSPTFDTTAGGSVSKGANISFIGTFNGADTTESPVFEAGTLGDIVFGGAVGNVTPPVDLTFSSAQVIEIGANLIVTGANPLAFPFPVQITGTSTISSVTNAATISFASTLDGPGGLTLNTAGSSGAVTFSEAVGSLTPLASLTVIGSTITQSSSVRTVGAITYTGSSLLIGGDVTSHGRAIQMIGPVVLSNTPLFDSTDGGSRAVGAGITFSSTVDGATSLSIAAGSNGIVTFEGNVGTTTPLTNLVFGSAASIEVGANITVTGANPLAFPSPVILLGMSTIISNNASITFNATLDGAYAAVVNAGTGSVTFQESIGGKLALASLTVAGAAITQGASLTCSGAAIYTNTGLLTLSGGISSASLNQSGGGSVLLEASITTTGSVVFTNPVTFNASLQIEGPSGITLNTMIPTLNGVFDLGLFAAAGTITATQLGSSSDYIHVLTLTAQSISIGTIYADVVLQKGAQTISSNLTAPGAYVLFLGPVSVATGGPFTINVSGGSFAGGVRFESTLDGPGALTLTVGTGNLRFDGAIGATTAMGDVNIQSAQNVTLYSDFTGSSFTQAEGGGTTSIIGTMTTTSSTGISLTGNNFDVAGSLITSGTGPIEIDNSGLLTLTGAVTAEGSFSQTGAGDAFLGNTITTTNALAGSSAISFAGPISLIENVTMNTSTGGGGITFASTSTIDGLQNLSLIAGTGDISAGGAMGSLTPLNNMSIYSGDDIDLPAITASSFKQISGTGTTTLDGVMTTIGDAGVVLMGDVFEVNALIQTFGKGPVIIQNSGTFTLSSSAQIKAAGPVVRKSSGTVSLSGNITSR